MTALKSLLFLVLAPGIVAGYIPLAFLRRGPQVETGFLAYLAFPLWLVGIIVLLGCFWGFIVKGHGTPAPINPPKELDVTGLYNYVRNPMYVGVLLMLIGHFLWFGYWGMLVYAIFFFVAFHLFILFYEEPTLRKKFGRAYEDYTNKVPRWIPSINK